MKHFKRIAGFCAALTLALSMSIAAFAAPSPSVSGTVSSGSGKDANGNEVTATIAEVTNTEAKAQLENKETLKEILGSDFTENMVVADVKEVSVPEGTTFPVELTFNISGITSSSKVVILHYNGSAWEKIAVDSVGNGTVTATFTSLSPIAFVVEGADNASVGTTSPKTGSSPVAMMAAFGALICVAGIVVLSKKERA